MQAFVDGYFQRLPLPLPKLNLQPGDRAVVNLPLVASTNPPQQTTFTGGPGGRSRPSRSPRRCGGSGVGATRTGQQHLARPKPRGTRPATSPGHHISHAYPAPSPGATIGVTAVWSGRYSVAGLPATRRSAAPSSGAAAARCPSPSTKPRSPETEPDRLSSRRRHLIGCQDHSRSDVGGQEKGRRQRLDAVTKLESTLRSSCRSPQIDRRTPAGGEAWVRCRSRTGVATSTPEHHPDDRDGGEQGQHQDPSEERPGAGVVGCAVPVGGAGPGVGIAGAGLRRAGLRGTGVRAARLRRRAAGLRDQGSSRRTGWRPGQT